MICFVHLPAQALRVGDIIITPESLGVVAEIKNTEVQIDGSIFVALEYLPTHAAIKMIWRPTHIITKVLCDDQETIPSIQRKYQELLAEEARS